MDDAGPYAARRSRQLIEVVDERVCERARLDARARMDHHPRRLIDDDKVFIFKDDIQRQRLRRQLDRGRLGQVYFYPIARAKPVARFNDAVVDDYVAVFNRPLYARAAYFVETRGKKRIETRARRVIAYDQELRFSTHFVRVQGSGVGGQGLSVIRLVRTVLIFHWMTNDKWKMRTAPLLSV